MTSRLRDSRLGRSLSGNPLRKRILIGGLIGLLVGLLAAAPIGFGPGAYQASARLAMIPEPGYSPSRDAGVWEVLNGGQATRTAAVVIGSKRFLPPGAADAGFELEAGAVPETTLIEVRVTASSPQLSEQVLEYVLKRALPEAGSASGPFALKIVDPAAGSAVRTSQNPVQLFVALGILGLLAGGAIGYLAPRIRETFDKVLPPSGGKAADGEGVPADHADDRTADRSETGATPQARLRTPTDQLAHSTE